MSSATLATHPQSAMVSQDFGRYKTCAGTSQSGGACSDRGLVTKANNDRRISSNPKRRYLVLGVDMNQAAFQAAGLHTHAGENPELRVFFFKLCRYLKLPVVLVFVPDGTGRPSIKRGRSVRTQPPWMAEYVQELVSAFGFYTHQAPGEAEAELAKLNSLGMIDAILTDDSDTLVFWRLPGSSDFDRILVYTADSIQHSDGVRLSRGGLLLFALLAGGDYDPGIGGCGCMTARALAACGFGDSLLEAATSMSGMGLQNWLHGWRLNLKYELQSNSQGHLKHRSPKFHGRLPLTSLNSMFYTPICIRSRHGHQSPQTLFQMLLTGKVRFRAELWEGIAFRMFCSPLILFDSSRNFLATPTSNFVLLSQTNSKTLKSRSVPSRRLVISTKNFQALMGGQWVGISADEDSVPVHVPSSILQTAVPMILQEPKPKQQSRQKKPVKIPPGSSPMALAGQLEVGDRTGNPALPFANFHNPALLTDSARGARQAAAGVGFVTGCMDAAGAWGRVDGGAGVALAGGFAGGDVTHGSRAWREGGLIHPWLTNSPPGSKEDDWCRVTFEQN
ncbi:PIN domain-like protein [Lyophyllum atratum]|nr:PIN domain-like protein [Lyophyllum atratum]